eukprot:m.311558 g.311558  ORF g.311558 m.311558 type:complete len:242 (+) comp79749_c0_seq1:41-766(+)
MDLEEVKERLLSSVGRSIVRSFAPSSSPNPEKGRAAVLVPLFQSPSDGSLHVLLTRRSMKVSSHKGEVCFPGGRVDADDKDATDTALRETEEEIGLPRKDVEIVCHLPEIFSRNMVRVRPVVGIVPGEHQLRINPDEVDVAFSMPLVEFLNPGIVRTVVMPWRGKEVLTHFFDYFHPELKQVFTVFGLTGRTCLAVAVCVNRKIPEFPLDPPGKSDSLLELQSLIDTSQPAMPRNVGKGHL